MNKPPAWFTAVVALALAWNVIGLVAVFSDLRLSAADVAALPAEQQALRQARPLWSVAGSIVAVVGGTLGALALLVRRREALGLLAASLIGVVLQDIGIFIVAGFGRGAGAVPFVLQGLVLAIAIGLLVLARHAARRAWL